MSVVIAACELVKLNLRAMTSSLVRQQHPKYMRYFCIWQHSVGSGSVLIRGLFSMPYLNSGFKKNGNVTIFKRKSILLPKKLKTVPNRDVIRRNTCCCNMMMGV